MNKNKCNCKQLNKLCSHCKSQLIPHENLFKHLDEAAGKKFDSDKTRLDLISPVAIEALGKVLTFGAAKYGERNWEKGIKISRLYGALMRHMWAYWRGEDLDPESGLSHLHHAFACLMMIIHFNELKKELDDRIKAL